MRSQVYHQNGVHCCETDGESLDSRPRPLRPFFSVFCSNIRFPGFNRSMTSLSYTTISNPTTSLSWSPARRIPMSSIKWYIRGSSVSFFPCPEDTSCRSHVPSYILQSSETCSGWLYAVPRCKGCGEPDDKYDHHMPFMCLTRVGDPDV